MLFRSVSFFGYLAIVLEYLFDITFLSDNMTALFLIIGGIGLLFIGKVFTIEEWIEQGLSKDETTQLLSIVIGMIAFVMGVILLLGYQFNQVFHGIIGMIAIFPAIFILVDYLTKNRGI